MPCDGDIRYTEIAPGDRFKSLSILLFWNLRNVKARPWGWNAIQTQIHEKPQECIDNHWGLKSTEVAYTRNNSRTALLRILSGSLLKNCERRDFFSLSKKLWAAWIFFKDLIRLLFLGQIRFHLFVPLSCKYQFLQFVDNVYNKDQNR